MARIHKKMALYEVIGKKRVTIVDNKKIEESQPDNSQAQLDKLQDQEDIIEAAESEAVAEKAVKWPTKPRIVQLHAGRVEISLPYQLAVAVVLVILLMALVCFRIGQGTAADDKKADSATADISKAVQQAVPIRQQPATAISAVTFEPPKPVQEAKQVVHEVVPAVLPEKLNVIVIQILADRKQLEPVKEFFAKNGIETEIVVIRGVNYLVTRQRFEEDPQASGSEGNFVLQQIRKLGLGYKSPPGYGTFGSKPFSGAYGMKLKLSN